MRSVLRLSFVVCFEFRASNFEFKMCGEEAVGAMPMSLFGAAKPRTRLVRCPFCCGTQEIPGAAQSVVCRGCNRSMQIGDQKITQYLAATELTTCGGLSVEKKASVIIQKRVVV